MCYYPSVNFDDLERRLTSRDTRSSAGPFRVRLNSSPSTASPHIYSCAPTPKPTHVGTCMQTQQTPRYVCVHSISLSLPSKKGWSEIIKARTKVWPNWAPSCYQLHARHWMSLSLSAPPLHGDSDSSILTVTAPCTATGSQEIIAIEHFVKSRAPCTCCWVVVVGATSPLRRLPLRAPFCKFRHGILFTPECLHAEA